MKQEQGRSWWTFGYVWLVVAGPAAVVVASLVTLYLAINSPDPVVGHSDGQVLQPQSAKSHTPSTSLAPAMQARNHAATGVPMSADP